VWSASGHLPLNQSTHIAPSLHSHHIHSISLYRHPQTEPIFEDIIHASVHIMPKYILYYMFDKLLI